jgi:GDP-D-mannose dehydratase
MAAQSLVRESYKTPVETFAANVMGTVNPVVPTLKCVILSKGNQFLIDKLRLVCK